MYNLALVCLFTFIIHFIGTIAYAVRLVGVRTRKIAISWSVFNVMSLGARVAQTLQAPLLARSIDQNISLGVSGDIADFRFIILSATIATVAGAIAIPTVHRFLEHGVMSFSHSRSMAKTLLKGLTPKAIHYFRRSLTWPSRGNLLFFRQYHDIPFKTMGMYAFTHAFVTVSVLACLYAGYLNPDLRSTTASMTGLSNSVSVVVMQLFVAPQIALLTDEVLNGTKSETYFRKYFVFVITFRALGTLLAQLLLWPLSHLLVLIAEHLYV